MRGTVRGGKEGEQGRESTVESRKEECDVVRSRPRETEEVGGGGSSNLMDVAPSSAEAVPSVDVPFEGRVCSVRCPMPSVGPAGCGASCATDS